MYVEDACHFWMLDCRPVPCLNCVIKFYTRNQLRQINSIPRYPIKFLLFSLFGDSRNYGNAGIYVVDCGDAVKVASKAVGYFSRNIMCVTGWKMFAGHQLRKFSQCHSFSSGCVCSLRIATVWQPLRKKNRKLSSLCGLCAQRVSVQPQHRVVMAPLVNCKTGQTMKAIRISERDLIDAISL